MGPRVDSLSNHQVTAGQQIFAYGAGFTGATRVRVGEEEATHVFQYDDTTIGFTVPAQPGGSTNWVVVVGADGTGSPCVGDGQLVAYLDEVLDAPRGTLRLDSITPSPVVAGRADSYWVLGAGLSAAEVVLLDGHSCDHETHDDARLVLRVPEFAHDSSRPTATLRVHTADAHADLEVECVVIADAVPHQEPPWIGQLDPPQLPAAGGRLIVHGGALDSVTAVGVGNADATIVEAHYDHVVVDVGSLEAYVHTNVAVVAVTPQGGTPTTELTQVHVTGD